MKTLLSTFFLISFTTILYGQTSCDKEINSIYKYIISDYPSNLKITKPYKEFQSGDDPFDTTVIYAKRQPILNLQLDTSTIAAIKNKLSENIFYKRVLQDNKESIDSLCISKKERIFIDSSLNNLTTFIWTENNKNQVGLTNFKLQNILNQKEQDKKVDLVVYDIMKPIYIRNCSIAFVYFYYACGVLCGHGSLIVLHKTQQGNWEEWKTLFSLSS